MSKEKGKNIVNLNFAKKSEHKGAQKGAQKGVQKGMQKSSKN